MDERRREEQLLSLRESLCVWQRAEVLLGQSGRIPTEVHHLPQRVSC